MKDKQILLVDVLNDAAEMYKNILITDIDGDGYSEICKDCVQDELKRFKRHLRKLWESHS